MAFECFAQNVLAYTYIYLEHTPRGVYSTKRPLSNCWQALNECEVLVNFERILHEIRKKEVYRSTQTHESKDGNITCMCYHLGMRSQIAALF